MWVNGIFLLPILFMKLCAASLAAPIQFSISDKPGNKTSKLQYGIFFEEIYFSGDGGIYAELIQNRGFQGSTAPNGSASTERTLHPYRPFGDVTLSIDTENPLSSALTHVLRVDVPKGARGEAGFLNDGFWGMDVKHQPYQASFFVKGDYSGHFTLALRSNKTNKAYASCSVRVRQSVKDGWQQHSSTILSSKDVLHANNSFSITFDAAKAAGKSLYFDLVSVFPPTFNNRQNGLRPDLVNALIDLNPGYLRWGGSNLEGLYPPFQWKWNETIGPLKYRTGRPGAWSQTNTDGLGVMEYFLWCEDMKVEPILSVWAGFYLNGVSIPEDQLNQYIQEALDLLEFVLGSPASPHGSVRARLGRRKPFKLTFVEIGNEDNLAGGKDSYERYRFDAFYSAISKAYPALHILASYTLANAPADTREDYHVYSRPDALVAKFNQWDNWNRSYPIIIGEYGAIQNNDASQSDVDWSAPQLPGQNMVSSTAEAVYLIGCERNSDVCHGTSWGALFKNWNFDPRSLALIKHTAVPSETIFSYSYYIQQMFSKHRVSVSLSVVAKHSDGSAAGSGGPIYHAAGLDEANKKYVMKFANYNGTATPITVQAPGNVGRHATLIKLSAESPFAYNSLGNETSIRTTSTVEKGEDGFGPFTLGRYEVAVLAIDV